MVWCTECAGVCWSVEVLSPVILMLPEQSYIQYGVSTQHNIRCLDALYFLETQVVFSWLQGTTLQCTLWTSSQVLIFLRWGVLVWVQCSYLCGSPCIPREHRCTGRLCVCRSISKSGCDQGIRGDRDCTMYCRLQLQGTANAVTGRRRGASTGTSGSGHHNRN